MALKKFVVGLDLGQANDYTALSILERGILPGTEGTGYQVRYLKRIRQVPYPQIVKKVAALMRSPPLEGNASLVVDQTGVGRAVVDLFDLEGLNPIAISIHGGDSVTKQGSSYRVPKRDLVGVLQVLLQGGRLKIAKLELSEVLSQEMLNFKQRIDPETAHDSYSAWREADHDDLVLSVALAAWFGEAEKEPEVITINIEKKYSRPYQPLDFSL